MLRYNISKACRVVRNWPGPMLRLLLCTLVITLAGCSRKNVAISAAPAGVAPENAYLDLQAGSTLRVVMPLLTSGGFRAKLGPAEANGNTISAKADDYIGYVKSEYAVVGNNGMVRLKFVAAQQTKGGQTAPEAAAPALPFALPRRAEHVRLVYLVRVSEADHNMAIVASKRLDRLNLFTAQLRKDPGACKTAAEVFCSWVPAGIAVRPEKH